jgi:hypothetical protein
MPGVNLGVTALTSGGAFSGDLNHLTATEAESITSVVLTGTFPASLTGSTGQGITIELDMFSVVLTQLAA